MPPLSKRAETINRESLHASVVDRIAEQLKHEIAAGTLPAGSRLVQGEIAARLGVSGTSVREAFYVLEHEGLISWDGRRGVRVFQPSVADLVEVYGIRAALESLAVSIATPILTARELEGLAGLLARMERLGESDRDQFVALNAEFHASVARASGQQKLIRLIDAQQTATSAYIRFLGGVVSESIERSNLEHRLIYTAILAGDPGLAAAAMESHLSARAAALQERIEPSAQIETPPA
ncbi:GntR family transcriptional regulator [Streptomyces solaniscabiei]|uniref:GntR family transcriptional regulator n=1 Tax=Streptomyces solaniscabiei TaxID=2683255 RepID=UPI001CE2D37B|nr:GntR family transcriptional regulator [Streptomyces solaniscabiei]